MVDDSVKFGEIAEIGRGGRRRRRKRDVENSPSLVYAWVFGDRSFHLSYRVA